MSKTLDIVKSKGHWGVAALLAVAAGMVAGQVVTPEQIGLSDGVLELIVGGVVGGLSLLAKTVIGKVMAPKEPEAPK